MQEPTDTFVVFPDDVFTYATKEEGATLKVPPPIMKLLHKAGKQIQSMPASRLVLVCLPSHVNQVLGAMLLTQGSVRHRMDVWAGRFNEQILDHKSIEREMSLCPAGTFFILPMSFVIKLKLQDPRFRQPGLHDIYLDHDAYREDDIQTLNGQLPDDEDEDFVEDSKQSTEMSAPDLSKKRQVTYAPFIALVVIFMTIFSVVVYYTQL